MPLHMVSTTPITRNFERGARHSRLGARGGVFGLEGVVASPSHEFRTRTPGFRGGERESVYFPTAHMGLSQHAAFALLVATEPRASLSSKRVRSVICYHQSTYMRAGVVSCFSSRRFSRFDRPARVSIYCGWSSHTRLVLFVRFRG
jgi:hypothetical protein